MAAVFADVAVAAWINPVQLQKCQGASIELGFAVPELLAATYRALQPVSGTLPLRGFLLLGHVASLVNPPKYPLSV